MNRSIGIDSKRKSHKWNMGSRGYHTVSSGSLASYYQIVLVVQDNEQPTNAGQKNHSHDVSVLAFRRLDEITKTEIAMSKKGEKILCQQGRVLPL
jgi:hypothetical protein